MQMVKTASSVWTESAHEPRTKRPLCASRKCFLSRTLKIYYRLFSHRSTQKLLLGGCWIFLSFFLRSSHQTIKRHLAVMVCEECVKTSNHNPLCLGAPCDIQIRPERSSRENTSHQQQQQQSLRQHAAKCCVVAVDDYRFSIRCLSFSPSCFIFMHLRNINQLKIKKANHY